MLTIGVDAMDPKLIMIHDDGEPFAWTKRADYAKQIAALPELLAIVRKIVENCKEGRVSRHQFADGLGSLAGCSMSLADVQAAAAVLEKIRM